MARVTDVRPAATPGDLEPGAVIVNHPAALVSAALAGGLLVFGARTGPVPLLVAIAVVQAALSIAVFLGMALPGRIGALVICALAAAGADVAVSLWPHGRLGVLLAVLALALPAMFVHQLVRGAARYRIVDSIGATGLLLVAVVGLAALVQLRHEFASPGAGAKIVAGVVAASAGALVIGHCVDLLLAAPRFDPAVARGLLAVVASAGLGGSIGHLLLGSLAQFAGGRGAFTGAALGALVAFLAVGAAYLEAAEGLPQSGVSRLARPVVSALLPLAVLAPVAFLLCLAIRA